MGKYLHDSIVLELLKEQLNISAEDVLLYPEIAKKQNQLHERLMKRFEELDKLKKDEE